MGKRQSVKTFFFCIILFLSCGKLVASGPEDPATLDQQVKGLWLYTGLITSAGENLPLKGIFLFTDDVFVQYAQYDGEPAKDQGSMAHAGPYSVVDGFIHMFAEQTFSTAPLKSPSFTSRGLTEHDVTVSRSGKELTLTFSKGTGTVQIFEHIGSGSGDVIKLENGALALVDGYFILVAGDENGMDAGYGTYDRDQASVKLNVSHWTQADQSATSNLNDTSMNATFDGQTLSLENGRSFQVAP